MVQQQAIRKEMSEAEVAYLLLRNASMAMAAKDLLSRIIEIKGLNPEKRGQLMSKIYTAINLDHRFIYMGKGIWGLKEWSPKVAAAAMPDILPGEKSYQPKVDDYLWDEDEEEEAEEDEDGLLVPVGEDEEEETAQPEEEDPVY